jgi:hypothetical protein
MSILYCSIISVKQKVKIAESRIGKEFLIQVKNMYSQILKGSARDRLMLDKHFLTYRKTPELIYLCVSPERIGEERPRLFIETLFSSIHNEMSSLLSDLTKNKQSIKELIFQSQIQPAIERQMDNFNTGIENSNLIIRDINKDVDNGIKPILRTAIKDQVENLGDLETDLIPKATNLKKNSKVFKKEGKELEGRTRFCCKPWVIRFFIIVGSILFSILIYIIVALVRCNDLNAFCTKINN